MFCERCGNRIPDGQTRCPACQAGVTPPAQQNAYVPQAGNQQPGGYQPNNQQTNGYQPGGYQPSSYQPSGYQPSSYQPGGYQPNNQQPNPYRPTKPVRKPRKKKSNMTGLLLVGGIAAVLVIVILVAVFSGVFASDEARLAKMEKTNAKVISEALSSSYGDYLEAMKDSLGKQDKGSGVEAEIKLNANEFFLESLIAPMMGGYGEVDMAWLKNVILTVDVDAKGEQMALACGVGVNDKVLATVSGSVDGKTEALYFGAPELNEQYLGMSLRDMGVEMGSMQALKEPTQKLLENMPSEKEFKKMIDRYLTVVFDYVEEVEKVKETVTVGDETKEMTVLRVKLTAPKMAEMCIKLMEMAREDETLEGMLLAIGEYAVVCESITEGISYANNNDLYEDLMYELDNTLQNLKDNLAHIGEDNYILMSNYTASGAIVGRKIEMYTDGMKEMDVGHYIFLPVGNGGVFEAVAEDVKISGSVKGKEIEINFGMRNRNMLTVVAEDVSFKNSVLNGTFRVLPSRELAMMADLDSNVVNALKLGTEGTYLELTLDGTAEKGTTAVKVVVGDNEMIGISMQVKETKFNKITAPKNALRVQDEDDLMIWASGIKFDKLTKNMTEAGVPDEYIQVVNQLAMMLQMSGMYS